MEIKNKIYNIYIKIPTTMAMFVLFTFVWFGINHYINEEFNSWRNLISVINESNFNILPTKTELDSIISNG